jgi:hypothetical protein
MKIYRIMLILSILFITFKNNCIGQDLIYLKSKQRWVVKIIDEYQDSLHFFFLNDHNKNIKNIRKTYIEDYYFEKDIIKFPFDTTSGKIAYTEVIKVPSKSKDEIYFNAKSAITKVFKSAKDVIQLDDKENGQLIVKGSFRTCTGISGNDWGNCNHLVKFTLTIQVKDGRYKYTIGNFYHESYSKNQGSGGSFENEKPSCGYILLSNNNWQKIKTQTQSQVSTLIIALKTEIESNQTPSQDESW